MSILRAAAILTTFTVALCCSLFFPPEAFPSHHPLRTQDPVRSVSAPLYATDGSSLYTLDHTTAQPSKIGDFHPPIQATGKLQLTYDRLHHFLYAFDARDFLHNIQGSGHFYAINPADAASYGPFVARFADGGVPAIDTVAYCPWNNKIYASHWAENGIQGEYVRMFQIDPWGWIATPMPDDPSTLVESRDARYCGTFDEWTGCVVFSTTSFGGSIALWRFIFYNYDPGLGQPHAPRREFAYYAFPYAKAMSVDPVSTDMFFVGPTDLGEPALALWRLQRGSAYATGLAHVSGITGIAFGEPARR